MMTPEQQTIWDKIQVLKAHFNPDRAKLQKLARELAETDSGICALHGGHRNDSRPGGRSPAFGKWKNESGNYRNE